MIRLSSHRLPFSLSIGGAAPPPPDEEGGGYAAWRVLHATGRQRLTMRVWDESTQRLTATGKVVLGWGGGANVRFVAGDELDLLGLDFDDEDGLIG